MTLDLSDAAARRFDFTDFTPVRMSVDSLVGLMAAGVVEDGTPAELLDGVLVHRDRGRGDGMPAGKDHIWAVEAVREWFAGSGLSGCHIRTESDARLDEFDLPQPDAFVVRGSFRDYPDRYPGPADILAVFEVSSTSLAKDRGAKRRLYARVGVSPYVIVNLRSRTLEVSSGASGGAYETRAVVPSGETVELLVGESTVRLAADDVLPPPEVRR